MSKRSQAQYEREIQQAIKRIGAKPEAREASENSRDWQRYLRDVLHVNPSAINDSQASSDFWHKVRTGVQDLTDTKNDYQAKVFDFETKLVSGEKRRSVIEKTGRIVYRDAFGRFSSGYPKEPKPVPVPLTDRQVLEANASKYYYLDKAGKLHGGYRNNETGRFTKIS